MASYPNEHSALAHLRRCLPWLAGRDLTISSANCLSASALAAVPAFLIALPRLWGPARRLARRFPFMPACRIFSALTYYLRFRRLLAVRAVRAAFIANHYSPECLALAAAAHRSGGAVLFSNHANATWRSGYAPPLHCDLAVVTSQAVLEAYTREAAGKVPAVFVPMAAPQQAMRARLDTTRPLTIGVYLTALTRVERLAALLRELEANPRIGRILIRSHPAKVVNDDLSGVCRSGGRFEDSTTLALVENMALCDLAICGNSTVTVELLRSGVPVFYDAALDGLAHDYNGYLQQGLVPALPTRVSEAALCALEQFYSAPGWVDTMRYYDAGYGRDDGPMLRRLETAVREAVSRVAGGARQGTWEPAEDADTGRAAV